jgi:hypothetical protein
MLSKSTVLQNTGRTLLQGPETTRSGDRLGPCLEPCRACSCAERPACFWRSAAAAAAAASAATAAARAVFSARSRRIMRFKRLIFFLPLLLRRPRKPAASAASFGEACRARRSSRRLHAHHGRCGWPARQRHTDQGAPATPRPRTGKFHRTSHERIRTLAWTPCQQHRPGIRSGPSCTGPRQLYQCSGPFMRCGPKGLSPSGSKGPPAPAGSRGAAAAR